MYLHRRVGFEQQTSGDRGICSTFWATVHLRLLKNGRNPASFILFSVFFKQAMQFLQQINVKNVIFHPVYGTGIRTHDLLNMRRLP